MNYGGDAAETVVRMSLESFEVAARITGRCKEPGCAPCCSTKRRTEDKGKSQTYKYD